MKKFMIFSHLWLGELSGHEMALPDFLRHLNVTQDPRCQEMSLLELLLEKQDVTSRKVVVQMSRKDVPRKTTEAVNCCNLKESPTLREQKGKLKEIDDVSRLD